MSWLRISDGWLIQVVELAAHLARSLPNATDASAVRDFVSSFESQLEIEDGGAELPDERKKSVTKSVVGKFSELRGGLEAAKEIGWSSLLIRFVTLNFVEPESAHLLLQYLLSSNFDVSTSEYQDLSRSVVEGVRKGGEAAAAAGRLTRAEAACRM